jgi:hypothetical protein
VGEFNHGNLTVSSFHVTYVVLQEGQTVSVLLGETDRSRRVGGVDPPFPAVILSQLNQSTIVSVSNCVRGCCNLLMISQASHFNEQKL